VRSVVPTVIQESGEDARPIEGKLHELAGVPDGPVLSPEEVAQVAALGDNTGCMLLKGASRRHSESTRPDEWPLRDDLAGLATRHGLGTDW
jgi:Ser/Thr protein kinase RdoA (MazF antagonist)